VYKITGALTDAKLQEVINRGIVAPGGIIVLNEGDWITCPEASIPVPYLMVISAPFIVENSTVSVPKTVSPANEPVADCPAVNITPPKFTGIFAILLLFCVVVGGK